MALPGEVAGGPPPKVSVFVLTYNHVDWIGRALDSALAQEAPFPYEILVADDCSSDGTREVVREYERRHPERISTFLPEVNRGVEGIWLAAAQRCRGEYVAILEGDDYWTSPSKLAKQAALLDARPRWISCFHRATLFHDDESAPPRPATPAFDRDVFALDDLIRSCFIPFLTLMFRRRALAETPDWLFSYAWFDWLFHVYCARQGQIGLLDEDMAAYRVHGGGNWSARDRSAQLEQDLRVYERLAREMPEQQPLLEACIENRHCQLAVEAIGAPSEAGIALLDPGRRYARLLQRQGRGGDRVQAWIAVGNGRAAACACRRGRRWRDAGPALRLAHAARTAAAPRPLPLHRSPLGRAARRARRRFGGPARRQRRSLLERRVVPDLGGRGRFRGESPRSRRRSGQAMGALVEIVEVSLAEPLPAELRGGFVDEPSAGSAARRPGRRRARLGAGRGGARHRGRVLDRRRAFWRAPLRAERPDLAEAFPDMPEAGRAGFRTTLNLIGTPPEFELEIAVVLKGQRRARLATVRGRHRWRRDRSPAFAELVSVVIPCYGQAHYLGEAIESVLAQTYPHLEILVIDDDSHDNASSIASRYPGVRCVREENAGMAGARNLGIRSTNGDFLVFLDADDRLLPEAIEAGLRELEEHPECAAAIGTYRRTATTASRSTPTSSRRSTATSTRS